MGVSGPQTETLGQLCTQLGPQLIEIVAIPSGLDAAVRSVVLHDRHESLEESNAEGSLVLLIGASPDDPDFLALLKEAGASKVSAVACRPGREWPTAAVEIAESVGVAILAVAQRVPWGQLYELIQDALAAGGATSIREDEDWSDLTDLSGIAEALAAIAGGPVAIEDTHSRVIAFSGTEGADEMRTNSILNRRVPKRWLSELHSRGVTQELLTSDEVIHITFEGLEPRRAIAIRLGKSFLGSIWLAGNDRDLSPDADAALRQAGKLAALQMMRQRLTFDVERQMRESYLGALLRGGEVTATGLKQLGLDTDDDYVVVAIEVTAKSASSPPTAGPRLIDLVTLHLRSYERPAVGTSLVDPPDLGDQRDRTVDERIYFLTSVRDADGRANLARIVSGALEHTSRTLGVELRGSIGHEVKTPQQIAEARQSADDCLVLEYRPGGLVQFDEVHARALLLDIDRVVSNWRGGPSAAFEELIAHDAANGTEYVDTLIALMDAFGNAATVAANMGIHGNTVRYRVRRISEICGIDLTNGVSRLALELELRAARGSH
jgi:sugar diacid utilization regulator